MVCVASVMSTVASQRNPIVRIPTIPNTRQSAIPITQGQLSYDRHIANNSKSNTEKEVDRLINAARKRGRNGARDAAAILLAYRHGLRAAELCAFALEPSRSQEWQIACE